MSLLPHVTGHTQCSSMPEELNGAIKKQNKTDIKKECEREKEG